MPARLLTILALMILVVTRRRSLVGAVPYPHNFLSSLFNTRPVNQPNVDFSLKELTPVVDAIDWEAPELPASPIVGDSPAEVRTSEIIQWATQICDQYLGSNPAKQAPVSLGLNITAAEFCLPSERRGAEASGDSATLIESASFKDDVDSQGSGKKESKLQRLRRLELALKRSWLSKVFVSEAKLIELKYRLNYAFAPYGKRRRLRERLTLDENLIQHTVQLFKGRVKPCRGFVAVDRSQRRIMVVFRGSTVRALSTFVADAKLFPTAWPGFWAHSKAHRGFVGVHKLCYDAYAPLVRQYLSIYSQARVIFIGHSLGGALGILGAVEFSRHYPEHQGRLEVTTFGSPRIGSKDFSRNYNLLNIPTNRVTNGFDLVSNLPFFYGYTHVAGEIYIIPETHETVYCEYNQETLEEDKSCSNRVTFKMSRLQDHSSYWGISDYQPYRLRTPSTVTLALPGAA
ncbi:hypothetical protein IWQ60_008183 [Tieghemiomyces parasiticus]|uniref:Fungal lipase-type domain-containing protein n=1 Tax=Tieghemiomyces parasiticus TaxID=78921 RepID=A0A9W7ZYX4_9FUNG|nr:hypothetical protein IWQ60_008183 [Tieghemiomyces parasiticus]